MRVGVDIVDHRRFAKKLESPAFLSRIFSVEELIDPRLEHLAGFFAAKEAAVKALGISAGSWHSLKLSNDKTGKPQIEFLPPLVGPEKYDLSIAHDGQYSVAIFVAE